jgi:hypothetical protein
MSKRTSSTVSNGAVPKDSSDSSDSSAGPDINQRGTSWLAMQEWMGNETGHHADVHFVGPAHDKQKLLLSSDSGHFSLVRALHLADLITELNGECLPSQGRPRGMRAIPYLVASLNPADGLI